MPAQVVSFLRRTRPVSRDWSQDELAEFYRVEAALLQSGMRIETDRGVTDEGDPWFAFCRGDDGETFIHFARIDGRYIIAGPAYEGVAQGYDFPELVRDLISRHPLVQPTLQRRSNTNIFLHPAALLIAVVGTAFFKTDCAKAAESSGEGEHKGEKRHILAASSSAIAAPTPPSLGFGNPPASVQVSLDAGQTLTLVASAMAAMAPATSVGRSSAAYPAATEVQALPATEAAAAALSDHAAASFMAAEGPVLATPHSGAVSVLAGPPAVIGAWLSLTALLQDLPRAQEVLGSDGLAETLAVLNHEPGRPVSPYGSIFAVPAQVPIAQDPSPAIVADLQAAHSQAKASAAAPAVLVVELRSGALPDVAAVRLVRDLGDGMSHDAVVKLEQLPTILAQLIAKGEHISTPAFLMGASTFDLPVVSHASEVSPLPAGDEAFGVRAMAEAVQVAGPDLSGIHAPVDPAEVNARNKATIDAIVSQFVARTAHTEVAINGHDILIFDTLLMSDTVVQGRSGSVTFSFDDGSSISLIGLASVLHDIGALH